MGGVNRSYWTPEELNKRVEKMAKEKNLNLNAIHNLGFGLWLASVSKEKTEERK